MGIKLFHKGRRNIHGHSINDRGEKVPFVFTPGTAVEFDDLVGANLKRLYAGEVISMDDVQKQFDQSTAPKGEVAKNPHGEEVVDQAALAAAEADKLKVIDDAVGERTYKALLAAGMTEEEARSAAYPVGADVASVDSVTADEKKAEGFMDRIGFGKKG